MEVLALQVMQGVEAEPVQQVELPVEPRLAVEAMVCIKWRGVDRR